MKSILGESNFFTLSEASFVGAADAAGDVTRLARLETAEALTALTGREVKLRFGRMFRRPNLPEFRPEYDGLLALGREMTADAAEADDSSLPAGYTYLGQFIDHDITFDAVKGIPSEIKPVEQAVQLRTPSLDLDSLYGAGSPLEGADDSEGPNVYADDGIHLRVGRTKPDSALNFWREYDNDLPRVGTLGSPPYKPHVVDPRNDENLAVAQTHLAFIKFHNAVVDRLRGDFSGVGLLEAARATVIRHYQSIVLTDFLPRLIDPGVLRRVIDEGCRHFMPDEGDLPFMPFEFSGAAFRLGHSLVRENYEWNRFFQSKKFGGKKPARLRDLHDFSTLHSDLSANDRLPSTWIVDWTRLYDLEGVGGMKRNPKLNFAKGINTLMSPGLVVPVASLQPGISKVPGMPAGGVVSIAVLDLFRGSVLGVPAAQSVVERLRDCAPAGVEIKSLSPDEIADGRQKTLKRYGLHRLTPLWYYVLREAEEFSRSEMLGPVGSHIVAETFVGLIKGSRTSILGGGGGADGKDWPLDLRTGEPKGFGMPALLHFVNDLNPLGDN